MEDWYVLYVKTGGEEKVKGLLMKTLNPNNHLSFIPYEGSNVQTTWSYQ